MRYAGVSSALRVGSMGELCAAERILCAAERILCAAERMAHALMARTGNRRLRLLPGPWAGAELCEAEPGWPAVEPYALATAQVWYWFCFQWGDNL